MEHSTAAVAVVAVIVVLVVVVVAAAAVAAAAVARPGRVGVEPARETPAIAKRVAVIAHIQSAVSGYIPDGVRHDGDRGSAFKEAC